MNENTEEKPRHRKPIFCKTHKIRKMIYGGLERERLICPVCSRIQSVGREIVYARERAKKSIRFARNELERAKENAKDRIENLQNSRIRLQTDVERWNDIVEREIASRKEHHCEIYGGDRQ